jgi:hypothetical protein
VFSRRGICAPLWFFSRESAVENETLICDYSMGHGVRCGGRVAWGRGVAAWEI